MNHFDYIKKYAKVIESRLDDEYYTFKNILKDNSRVLNMAQKYNVNYIIIDDKYNIEIDL